MTVQTGRRGPVAHLSRSILIVAVLVSATMAVRASASSLIVPDDVPTIQGALNALVDTVFVRGGAYEESPVVFAQVLLVGIPGDSAFARPVLTGLTFNPGQADFPTYTVRNMEFSGPVHVQNDDVLCFIVLDHCRIGGGMSDISAFPATAGITLHGCQIESDVQLITDGNCVIDSCLVSAQVVAGFEDCHLTVTDSQFHGNGSGVALGTFQHVAQLNSATITGTTIDHYAGGIEISVINALDLENNNVRDCQYDGVSVDGDLVQVVNNRLERCGGNGIGANGNDHVVIVGNAISGCGTGVLALAGVFGTVSDNVVWGCSGDGIVLRANPVGASLEVMRNTSCLNAGAGFESKCSVFGRYEFSGNIGYRNREYGVLWTIPEVSVVGCNDWFGNSLGDVLGLPPSGEDFAADPLFCDPSSGDFHLAAGSPLVDRAGCGLVGALGVGCSVTATLVSRFTAERVADGIQIIWELGASPTADAVWLERSESSSEGVWLRPLTAHSHLDRAEVELDHSAAPGRTYWYRLVASERGSTVVIGQPIAVSAEPASAFRLALVGPSPSPGPVQIEFELARPATIALEVFDVQGRLVASPARGAWPAGRHAVAWSGASGNAHAAAGLYLVRYSYPGGQDLRRLIRTP